MWFIRMIYWLQAFAAPALLFGLIALWVYSGNEKNGFPALVLLILGVIAGIAVAEYIRRKIGLETFFGRLYGPSEMDEKLKRQKDQKKS